MNIRLLNDIKKAGNKLIIPVNFPEAPDVKDPYDAASVTYTTLKHYELAPSNLSRSIRCRTYFCDNFIRSETAFCLSYKSEKSSKIWIA